MSKKFEHNLRVGIVGLGYIGLPTAAILSKSGYSVLGIEIREEIVNTVNSGRIHIHEPDLQAYVEQAVSSGKLRASLTPEPCDIFIIAVPTPFKSEFKPDISFVESAAELLTPVLQPGNLVIVESTIPVGTTEIVRTLVEAQRSELKNQIHFAHCPERVLPGQILHELIHNDRIVGGLTTDATQLAVQFYQSFVRGQVLATNARTAELCKLSENAFRDVNVAFANELSRVCEKLDIDVWNLIQMANRHPRVRILQPGPGVGGHCIPVDPWFIVDSAPELTPLIQAARHVNMDKTKHTIASILSTSMQLKVRTVACLGLSFKANVDDLRESPAMEIVEAISHESDLQILAVEPHIGQLPATLSKMANVRLVNLSTAIDQADLAVVLVDHDVFKRLDLDLLRGKSIIDTKGIWQSSSKLSPYIENSNRNIG